MIPYRVLIQDTISGLKAVDKLIAHEIYFYGLKNIMMLMKEVEKMSRRRIYLEMHLTGGIIINGDKDYIGGVSLKYNLFNPKYPNFKKVLAYINQIHNLAEITGVEIPDKMKSRLAQIEKRVRKYKKRKTRLSFGVTFPLKEIRKFNFDSSFVFIGLDINDELTLQFGCRPVNGREAYFGMSIDLTTRFYSLAEEFKDAVAYLFRLNRGREENYFYYYP